MHLHTSSVYSLPAPRSGAWLSALRMAYTAALLLAFCTVPGVAEAQRYNATVFGPNVYVFSPSVPESAIEAQMSKLAGESQFSNNRYAVLFQPGSYTVKAPVGFYESVSGLGQTPGGTSITGFLTPDTDPNFQANLTDYFWRSLENMSVTATPNPQQGVQDDTFMWGVSQGAPLRRMQFSGSLQLTNEWCGWTSGGFISDTSINGNLNFCSQQQWFTRNSSIAGKALYGNWNMVFAGVTGAPATSFPSPAYTALPQTPVSREKPFLYMDGSGNYRVFVPAPQTGSAGTSWSATSMGPGTSQPIENFFIAQPSDSAAAMNTALASGLNLILTPGIYPLDEPLTVTNPNTVILGMGYADLVPQAGGAAIQVADVDGVQIAGLMIDAGRVNSPVLLQLGTPGAARASHHANPTAVDDVFLRIGGPTPGSATTSIKVDSNDVILDDIWAWRADHGPDNLPAGAPPTYGWTVNTAAHGLVVNGDNVTAMGLAVEHYQQEQVLWNGDNGQTIFFQSEMPYDPPSQAAWMDGAVDGYPAYAVAPGVLQHQGYGFGVYSNFTAAPVVAASAITVPDTPGVAITDAATVFLNSYGSIAHIVNGEGASVQGPQTAISYLNSYGGQPCAVHCGGAPAIPANLTASAGSSGQINLVWTDATPGVYYTVYRSPASGFAPGAGTQVATSLSVAGFADSGLAPSTTYYYVVTASNAGGTSAPSAQASAATTVAGACTTLPPTSQTVLAEQTTATQNVVTWGATAASAGCPVTYTVYRSQSGVGPPTPANQVAANIRLSSFNDAGLTVPAGYFYSVQAVDAAGASAPSAWVPVISLSNWTQVWADDFGGASNTTFDSTKWVAQVVDNHGQDPFGDGTIMSTTASLQNAYQDGNGDLVVAMTYDPASGRYSSSRLVSAQPIGPYGRIEARIITPSAQGMGSAFWSQGSSCFGANPTSYWPLCGELDIEESQALNPGHTATTIHGLETDSQQNYEFGGISAPVDLPAGETLSQTFHTYAVQWAPYHLQYFLDGKQYGDVTLTSLGASDLWAFNAPINFILSSGVGGNGGTPNGVGFPSNMMFDYVHYAQWAAGAPVAVTNLSATATYSNAVTLNWNASSTAGVTYNIYAGAAPGYTPGLQNLVAQGVTGTTYQHTGLQPSTTYFYTVVASNFGGESAASNATVTTPIPGNSTGLQLNAGGYAAGTYMTSNFVAGGNTNYHPGEAVNTAQVTSPAPQAVYDTERWGPAAWTISGLNPGAGYNVTLHFVELAHQAQGQRSFNVLVNSAVVERNFDIVAAAGAPQTAITRTFFTKADENGIIEVQTALGTNAAYGVDLNPTVAALEVSPGSGSAPVGAAPGTTASVQINSGGAASGTFAADTGYTSGTATASTNSIATSGVTNAAAPVVYATQRQGASTYVLTGLVADATYTLRLHFVETGSSATGATISAAKQRVFNVAVNGTPVLQDFDLFAQAGLDTAVVQQLSANADAYGQMIVQLQSGTADQPTIAGVEAVQASAAVAAPTALTATGNSGTVALAWTASSTPSATYTVYRATSGTAVAPVATGLTATGYADGAVTGGSVYTYYVVANAGAGRSFPSNSATAAVLQGCTAVPTAPANLSVHAANAGSVVLGWTASTSSATCPVTYTVFRSATPNIVLTAANSIASGLAVPSYTDTAASPSTAYVYAVQALDGAGSSAITPAVSTGACTASCVSLLAVNTGGGAAPGFMADAGYSGGGIYTTGKPVDTSGVLNAAAAAVYRSERSGAFTYTLPGLTPGAVYTVRLHFAEIWFQSAGQRVFDVSINSAPVLVNFDIAAIAGPNAAVVRQFTTTADALGRINVAFTRGLVDQPKISGIEVLGAAGSGVPMPAGNLTASATVAGPVILNWLPSATPGVTYTVYASTRAGFTPLAANLVATGVTVVTYTHTGLAAGTNYFYAVQAVSAAGASAYTAQASATTAGCTACVSLVAVNAGGPVSGNFATDTAFTGGGASAVQGPILAQDVVNVAPVAVYQTARAGTFSYTLSGLTPGASYALRLHFAETYFASAGQRLFNVGINSMPVLTNFDIVAAAGGEFRPLVEQFAAAADANGSINVSFTSGAANQAVVSGLELLAP